MHQVCQQWTTAVRCNMHSMKPAALHTEQLKLYFPAVRHLYLHRVPFQQNSTLCLATMQELQTLRIQNCSFDAGESVAELAALSGKPSLQSHHHCCLAPSYKIAIHGVTHCNVPVNKLSMDLSTPVATVHTVL